MYTVSYIDSGQWKILEWCCIAFKIRTVYSIEIKCGQTAASTLASNTTLQIDTNLLIFIFLIYCNLVQR